MTLTLIAAVGVIALLLWVVDARASERRMRQGPLSPPTHLLADRTMIAVPLDAFEPDRWAQQMHAARGELTRARRGGAGGEIAQAQARVHATQARGAGALALQAARWRARGVQLAGIDAYGVVGVLVVDRRLSRRQRRQLRTQVGAQLAACAPALRQLAGELDRAGGPGEARMLWLTDAGLLRR